MKHRLSLFVAVLAAAALSLPSLPRAVADPVVAVTGPVTTVTHPADVAAGEQIYARCIGCHSPDRNRTGPQHCGLIGRKSGAVPDYDYSEAMKTADIIWNTETLNSFLQSPMTEVPGTTMGFAGIADADERHNLIAWLATLNKDNPLCSL